MKVVIKMMSCTVLLLVLLFTSIASYAQPMMDQPGASNNDMIESCPICLNDLNNAEEWGSTLKLNETCQHEFHEVCLKRWFDFHAGGPNDDNNRGEFAMEISDNDMHGSCPLCRQRFGPIAKRRLRGDREEVEAVDSCSRLLDAIWRNDFEAFRSSILVNMAVAGRRRDVRRRGQQYVFAPNWAMAGGRLTLEDCVVDLEPGVLDEDEVFGYLPANETVTLVNSGGAESARRFSFRLRDEKLNAMSLMIILGRSEFLNFMLTSDRRTTTTQHYQLRQRRNGNSNRHHQIRACNNEGFMMNFQDELGNNFLSYLVGYYKPDSQPDFERTFIQPLVNSPVFGELLACLDDLPGVDSVQNLFMLAVKRNLVEFLRALGEIPLVKVQLTKSLSDSVNGFRFLATIFYSAVEYSTLAIGANHRHYNLPGHILHPNGRVHRPRLVRVDLIVFLVDYFSGLTADSRAMVNRVLGDTGFGADGDKMVHLAAKRCHFDLLDLLVTLNNNNNNDQDQMMIDGGNNNLQYAIEEERNSRGQSVNDLLSIHCHQ